MLQQQRHLAEKRIVEGHVVIICFVVFVIVSMREQFVKSSCAL
jgi:hypothetical protein